MMRTLAVLFVCLALVACQVLALPFWVQKTIDDLYHLEWSPFQTDLIEDCSDEDYILDITDITLTPAFPVPGEEILIEAEGTLREPVEIGASARVTVKLGVVTLIRRTFDLCEEAKKNELEVQCPVQQGQLKVTKSVKLPKEIPKGDFRVLIEADNYDDAPLACLKIHVDFRRRRFF